MTTVKADDRVFLAGGEWFDLSQAIKYSNDLKGDHMYLTQKGSFVLQGSHGFYELVDRAKARMWLHGANIPLTGEALLTALFPPDQEV